MELGPSPTATSLKDDTFTREAPGVPGDGMSAGQIAQFLCENFVGGLSRLVQGSSLTNGTLVSQSTQNSE